MNLLRIFGLWEQEILEKNCCTKGTVTMVQTSFLHVVKKPVRIGINPNNTIFSHFITFEDSDGMCINNAVGIDV